jgi:hypothetical protein
MYAEFATDPVVQSLAFDDQRHYVVLLCLKCSGVLDRDIDKKSRDRIICRGLGLDPSAASETKRRLMDVGLINKDWQPKNWDKRQFSDRNGATAIPPGKNAKGYIYFITDEDGENVKIGFSKNPFRTEE